MLFSLRVASNSLARLLAVIGVSLGEPLEATFLGAVAFLVGLLRVLVALNLASFLISPNILLGLKLPKDGCSLTSRLAIAVLQAIVLYWLISWLDSCVNIAGSVEASRFHFL